ncbi:SPOR domain-containing protein [Magnetospira sp. QH-2]|uniref:SPOR domain-containing protein n=1 Tax=Magnetospira sp. (strain QH-2) TaxID=1288970 RepID=UPI0005F9B366|nr:SPOR domain-containing protein [Magnetospira sp. QH-2]
MYRYAAMIVATTTILAGCGVVTDQNMLKPEFWTNSPLKKENVEAELGIAELTKGNFVLAESHFDKALKANPNDVHALLGRAILYHHTGQVTRARAMYEAVLALRPPETEQLMVMNNFTTRPVSEIASVNMSLLQSGNVVGQMERGAAGLDGAPQGSAMTGPVSASGMGPSSGGMDIGGAGGMGGPMVSASTADANIVSRFETLRALRDQGLIAPDEYLARRKTNVGALVPFTSPPPAAGLDRSVPTTDQILGRLRAIGRALEMRAMTVGQHAAEREMILDALLPETPVAIAAPSVPPKGLMKAADAVRRLEMLQEAKLITSDEYAKERKAIESGLQPEPPASLKAMGDKAGGMAMAGPKPAVHVASYRSEAAARKGWSEIQKAHRALLGSLQPEITKVNLGRGKGTYYRLKAGPLTTKAASQDLCRKLKRRKQFCEPSFINQG